MYQVKQEVDRFPGFGSILLSLCFLGQCHDTGRSKLEWAQEGLSEEGGIGGSEKGRRKVKEGRERGGKKAGMAEGRKRGRRREED